MGDNTKKDVEVVSSGEALRMVRVSPANFDSCSEIHVRICFTD